MLQHNVVLEVNLKKFKNNIKKIKDYVGNKTLMPVIKANGYGSFIQERIDILNMFNIVAVANVSEAIKIRKIGYDKDIFVLNQPSVCDIENIHNYDISVGISEKSFIEKVNLPIKVHLEIETGMNRTGIFYDQLDDYIELIKNNNNINVVGIYTHLSSADNDMKYTNKQLSIFHDALELLKKHFSFQYIHSEASNGLLNCKSNDTNTVRPGLVMYGYETFPGMKKIIPVEEILRLKSKIIYLKKVSKGSAISYNQKYVSPKELVVATIPIGYADGYRRSFSNKAYVVVNGNKCPVLGNVCMDSCMIDVTGCDCKVEDEVYIFDNNLVTLDELSEIAGTISYELMCNISNRVQRVFIEK